MKEVTREMTLAEVFEVLENNKTSEIDNRQLWFDWFCRTSSIQNRGTTLLSRLKSIRKSTKFDKEITYVWFKNNCPCDGGLYDDFRIADRETHDVIYTISPRDNYGYATVWGRENNFQGPLLEGTWKDVKAFFLA